MTLSNPPNQVFETCEEAIESVSGYAASEGYATVKARTIFDKKVSKSARRYILACERFGKPTTRAKICKTGSRKVDCQWRANLKLTNVDWEFEVDSSAQHNYGPSESQLTHPILRRRNDDLLKQIHGLAASKVDANQILTTLREQGVKILDHDVWNVWQKWRTERLNRLSPLEALLEGHRNYGLTSSEKYQFEVKNQIVDDKIHLKSLFIMHPSSLTLLEQASDVLLMDCTYKTNKFGMPLLHIVGQNGLDKNFTIAFCFLSKEDEGSYTFAVSQLKRVYTTYNLKPRVVVTDKELALKNALTRVFPTLPQLLCCWYISKNLQAKAAATFLMSNSCTEEEKELKKARRDSFLSNGNTTANTEREGSFLKHWTSMVDGLRNDHHELSQYLEREWWPYRHQFVRCYIDRERNYGARVTSRIEGAHAELMQHLRILTGNLLDVVESIHIMIKNKTEKILESMATAKQRTPHYLRKPYFKDIILLVTPTSLAHLQGQMHLTEASDSGACSGGFKSAMGLPCKHDIKTFLSSENWKTSINQIDQHWWFDREDTPPIRLIPGDKDRLLEPLVVKKKGRPKKPNQPVRSTARNLSF